MSELQADLSEYFMRGSAAPQREFSRDRQYLEAHLPHELFVTVNSPSALSNSAQSMSAQSMSASASIGSLGAYTNPGRQPTLEADLPEPGAIIDKYRIEKLVGVGGFAAVYRATHLLLHTPVAIKMLRPSVLKRKPELAPLLFEEARVAARINHPNVVRVNDVTHTPNITYVVIEFIDGGSLSDLLHQTTRLSIGKALRIGIDVTEGLKAGLAVGIIHRDIKPGNILLTSSGQAKVADLGLARAQGSAMLLGTTIVGTPGYMAPEQAVDPHRVDFRADVYGLGVTLYHAMVGSPPFPLGNRQRSIELHRSTPPPLPSSRIPGFPKSVEALLIQMLAKKIEQRHASYDALLSELRLLAKELLP